MHLKEDNLHLHEEIHDKIFEIGERERVIESGGYFINGGDTFHVRGLIRTSCFDLLHRKRKGWLDKGLKKHIDIIGNHDQEDKDGNIHPMRVFEQFGWHVVDRPMCIDNFFYAFPYMNRLEEEILKIPTAQKKKSVALVHTGVHGAFKNDGTLDDFSIHPEAFKDFRMAFSGHYHNRILYGTNFQFIGSPMQHTFSEMGQDKGVLIYNRKLNKYKFVEIPGPKHKEVSAEFVDGKMVLTDTDDIGESDIVRVRIHGSSAEVSSVTKSDFEFKCGVMKIERKTVDASASRIKVDDASSSDLLEMYVDYVDPDLDRKKLLMIGAKFMGETSHANV